MHAAGAGQSHDVQGFAVLLCIGIGVHDLGVLHDGTVLDALVDLDQVLIDDAATADVQVAHLAVAHLPVGQTYVLAASLERAVRISCTQEVEIRRGSTVNRVAVTLGTLAPTVQYH